MMDQRGLRTDDAHVVCNRNFGPIWLRHLLEPLQDLPGHQSLCQHGPAALWNRASETHVNGVEGDFFQGIRLVGTHRSHTVPEHRVSGKAALASIRAGFEIIAGGVLSAKAEALIAFIGDPGYCLILENKIPQAVENGPALVDFDTAHEVGAVPSEQIAALIDGPMRKLHQEVRRRGAGAAVKLPGGPAFVAMDTVHQPVRLLLGPTYPVANAVQIVFIDSGLDLERLSQMKLTLQEPHGGAFVQEFGMP